MSKRNQQIGAIIAQRNDLELFKEFYNHMSSEINNWESSRTTTRKMFICLEECQQSIENCLEEEVNMFLEDIQENNRVEYIRWIKEVLEPLCSEEFTYEIPFWMFKKLGQNYTEIKTNKMGEEIEKLRTIYLTEIFNMNSNHPQLLKGGFINWYLHRKTQTRFMCEEILMQLRNGDGFFCEIKNANLTLSELKEYLKEQSGFKVWNGRYTFQKQHVRFNEKNQEQVPLVLRGKSHQKDFIEKNGLLFEPMKKEEDDDNNFGYSKRTEKFDSHYVNSMRKYGGLHYPYEVEELKKIRKASWRDTDIRTESSEKIKEDLDELNDMISIKEQLEFIQENSYSWNINDVVEITSFINNIMKVNEVKIQTLIDEIEKIEKMHWTRKYKILGKENYEFFSKEEQINHLICPNLVTDIEAFIDETKEYLEENYERIIKFEESINDDDNDENYKIQKERRDFENKAQEARRARLSYTANPNHEYIEPGSVPEHHPNISSYSETKYTGWKGLIWKSERKHYLKDYPVQVLRWESRPKLKVRMGGINENTPYLRGGIKYSMYERV